MDRLKAMGPAIRVVVSLAMLAILMSRLDLSRIIPAQRHYTAALIALALVATTVGMVLSALRWRLVLCALELPTKIRTAIRLYLAGLFVGNFLPSTVGGDLVRIMRLPTATGERSGPFASVVLERMTGWVVLPVITLATLRINPGLLHLGSASRVAVLVSTGTLVLLMGILTAAGHPRLGGRLTHADGWARFLGAIHLGLVRFRHRPRAAFSILGVSFAYQLVVAAGVYVAAGALDLHLSVTAVLAFMPAVAIVSVVPLTIGGLGIREGAFVLFLHPLGVSTSQAIALGLMVYAMNLTVSLLGAPALAFTKAPRVAA
ncbi:MAG: lysylphosphatidylglycerol synthase transmembrane domain-containing protein [Acidimicrobiales bacterium]